MKATSSNKGMESAVKLSKGFTRALKRACTLLSVGARPAYALD